MPDDATGSGSESWSEPVRGVGLVWARSADGVIGADGGIPWHVPEDLAHFREVTGGATVVMGRRTWDSLPERFRPLPGRRNVVLTRDTAWSADGAVVVHDLAAALDTDEDVWVIGGGQVYAAALPFADRVSETVVDAAVTGDTTAPTLDAGWTVVDEGPWQASRIDDTRYRFTEWRRA